jgi:hypothetical protein
MASIQPVQKDDAYKFNRTDLGKAVRAKCLDDGLGKIGNPQDRDERLPKPRLPAAWAGSAQGACAWRVIAVGSAESLVPALVGFASLTAAWLLVAVGMGRQGTGL